MKLPLLAATFALSALLAGAPALASLDTVIGPRVVVQNQPISDCSSRASSALKSAMPEVNEAGTGSGEWVGVIRDASGAPSATAVIECHTLPDGYAASFTCLVQVPPSDTASVLCQKLSTAFGGGAQ